MLQSEVYYFFLTVIVNYHYQSPFSRKKVSTRALTRSAIDVFSSKHFRHGNQELHSTATVTHD